ncbi:hypothetical protein [Andreprevotia lacus]|uniref:hypothetical protein n=1 Tax=Andreprevotia lacus TaxID=1121000 RepID=UPI000A058749|nr:hypothetical protein [Andreprevotia lacus]
MASYAVPQTGWYWNPAEGGRGYAIEVQGNQIFLVAFMYETNGVATWYASTLTQQANGQYAGELMRYAGGQTLGGAYKAPSSNRIAYVVAAFSSAGSGNLLITPVNGDQPVSTAIQRFPISTPNAFSTSAAGFQNGWYWNDAEGGRGYFVEVQGTQAFVAAFMYDSSGQPTWYVANATLNGGQQLSGPMLQYAGGQSLLSGYKTASQKPGNSGNISFSLNGGQGGSIVLPGGGVVASKRFSFNPDPPASPPSCSSPQVYINGACTTPTASAEVRPVLMLLVSPSPVGTTYQAELCWGGASDDNCDLLGNSVFVSIDDLRDPNEDMPATLAYVKQVEDELNAMLSRIWSAKTIPSRSTVLSILSQAIEQDLADEGLTAVPTATKAFVDAGYPAANPSTVVPVCNAPQVLSDGVCKNPAVVCTSPKILQNGECVTPLPLKVDPIYGYMEIPTPVSHASQDYICKSWQVIGAPIKLSSCGLKAGSKGGYSVVENDNSGPADVCYRITYKDRSTPEKLCFITMASGEVKQPACYSCGTTGPGVNLVELDSFKPK